MRWWRHTAWFNLRSRELAKWWAQDSKIVLLTTCGIGFDLSPHLWCAGLFWGVADSGTDKLSFHRLALSHHVVVEAPGYDWLPGVRTDVLRWHQATSHIFLRAWKLEPSRTHEKHLLPKENLLRRTSDVFEVVAICGGDKRAAGPQGPITKNPVDPTHPSIWPWDVWLNPFTFQFSLRIIPAPHRLVCKHSNNLCMRLWLIKALPLCHLSLWVIILAVL